MGKSGRPRYTRRWENIKKNLRKTEAKLKLN
jgi:hypothetical protein